MPFQDDQMMGLPSFGGQPPQAQAAPDPAAFLETLRRLGVGTGLDASQGIPPALLKDATTTGGFVGSMLRPAAPQEALRSAGPSSGDVSGRVAAAPPQQMAQAPPVDTWGLTRLQREGTGEETLAARGMPSPNAGGMPAGPVPQQLLGAGLHNMTIYNGASPTQATYALSGQGGGRGPDLTQLQMMGAQPALSFNGNTMISRNVNQPALAELLAGVRPGQDTLIATETQTPIDPQHIASWMGGQLAPTPEQKALALEAFSRMQQGAAGLMNAQEIARANQANEAIRRQTELVGGIPTALAVSQHGAQTDQVKTILNAYLSTLPKDQNGQIQATPDTVQAALQLAESEMGRRGLGGLAGGLPPGAPPQALLGGGQQPPAATDPDAQARAILNKTSSSVGESPLRGINQAAVNALMGEKGEKGDWKYAADPVMALARLKQLLPPDQYANNADAVRSFLGAHYDPDTLNQTARAGVQGNLYAPAEIGRGISWLLGNPSAFEQPLAEIFARRLGIAPAYQQGRADLRQLYPQ